MLFLSFFFNVLFCFFFVSILFWFKELIIATWFDVLMFVLFVFFFDRVDLLVISLYNNNSSTYLTCFGVTTNILSRFASTSILYLLTVWVKRNTQQRQYCRHLHFGIYLTSILIQKKFLIFQLAIGDSSYQNHANLTIVYDFPFTHLPTQLTNTTITYELTNCVLQLLFYYCFNLLNTHFIFVSFITNILLFSSCCHSTFVMIIIIIIMYYCLRCAMLRVWAFLKTRKITKKMYK